MKNRPVSHFGADALLTARRVMFVGAHPDDIEFYCGATIRLMAQKRITVSYLVATKGDHNLPGFLGKLMKKVRSRDQYKAAQTLGISDVTIMDYPDGHLSDHIKDFAREIASLAIIKRPDIVVSWDPNHIYNPHPDHQATGQAVRVANLRCKVACFGTTEPDLLVPVDNIMLKAKLKAIRCHTTEAPWFYYFIQRISILRRLRRAGAMAGLNMAECYRLNTQNDTDSKLK